MAYGQPVSAVGMGDVNGIFDALKSVVSTISKGVRVFQQGATAVIRPPGAPPIYIDLTDPNALRRARDAAAAILRGSSVQLGRPPTAFDQAGSFLQTPVGMAVVAGVGLLALGAFRGRGR
jgi:hypothetical protein